MSGDRQALEWRRRVAAALEDLRLDPPTKAEIVEEFAQDLEQRYADLLAAGDSPEQARRSVEAQLDPAGLSSAMEAIAAARTGIAPALLGPQAGRDDALVAGASTGRGWWADARQDLRYAARTLARSPGFAIVAILTLALGVGATTAIFGIIDAILLRPLPYVEADRLVHLFEDKRDGEFGRREASWPDFVDWSARDDLFSGMAGYNGGSAVVTAGGSPQRVQAVSVTDGFFPMLGVRPARGRLFLPGEAGPGGKRVVVLTWGFWQSRFGGNDDVVGSSLPLSGTPYTVVGVLPQEFQFPLRGDAQIWVPLIPSERRITSRSWHWLDVIARLRPGVTPAQVRDGMADTFERIADEDPQWHGSVGVLLVPLRQEMVGPVRPALLAVGGTVGLLMLIVCANLANLTLARAAGRRQEIAIRAALGAGRSRLIRQLLTESLLLAVLGGAVGTLVARWGTALLLAPLPRDWVQDLPHLREFQTDWKVFVFVLCISAASAILFGLAPALQASRPGLTDALRAGRVSGGDGHGGFGNALVVGQVALTLVLLVGAGLVTRSLFALMDVSPGFDTGHLLTSRLGLPTSGYPDDGALTALHASLHERLARLPGVTSVATVNQLPLTGRGNSGGFKIQGRDPDDRVEANIRSVSPGYFATLGIPRRDGRGFQPADGPDAPPVVLVNETLAQRVFAGDAVGRWISFNFFPGEPWWEVVGVVGDERVDSLEGGITPVVYFAYDQSPGRAFNVVLRTSTDPESVTASLRREVRALDAGLPLYATTTIDGMIARSTPVFLRRYLSSLIGGFALLAALLSAIGVYGVTAGAVERRRRELGLRAALGAVPRQVMSLVLLQGLRMAIVGIAIGLVASIPATRALSGVLFGVSRTDVTVLAGGVALVVVVTLLACALPARRAMRDDPLDALRAD